MTDLNEHQEFERDWWGECLNTFGEEAKQITYAHHMGLVNIPDPVTGVWPQYDLEGRSVLDIGGGPASMLLKCVSGGVLAVVDPCPYPAWTRQRYAAAGITLHVEPAESFSTRQKFDEVWIYNVLQHVEDPEAVLATARAHASILRIFEWIDLPPSPGHPHMLTVESLDRWINSEAINEFGVGPVNENGCVGTAYHGVFVL